MREARRIAVSLLALVTVWMVLSVFNSRMFPSPVRVGGLIVEFVLKGDIDNRSAIYHLWITFGRVLMTTGLALGAALVIGIAMKANQHIADVFEAWLPVWMTPPDVVVILIVMVIVGFNTEAVVIAVTFVYTPFALVTIWQGLQEIDPKLIEMAISLDADRVLIWRSIVFPHLLSYIFASVRHLFGMTWKVVVIAEVFGISNGVGSRIRFWFLQSNIAEVLAYAVLFIGVVLIIEYGVLSPVQRHLFDWRST
jgi:ABC-type nitrate/sulfonate/bicarbonate transport system, permease component